jgi:hypothetical protein
MLGSQNDVTESNLGDLVNNCGVDENDEETDEPGNFVFEVERKGFEPSTSALRTQRSPN